MSQSWTDNCFQSDHVVATDMQFMEDNFACLKSMFSGSSAPSFPVKGMPWFDTTNKILRIRNYDSTAWIAVLYGSTSTKKWIYKNTAGDGWVIDSTVYDVVLAIKGGTEAYNVNGGNTAGTWTTPTHTLTIAEMPSHSHTYQSYTTGINGGSGGGYEPASYWTGYTGGGGAHSHGTLYRPYAAIGTLQYPNI